MLVLEYFSSVYLPDLGIFMPEIYFSFHYSGNFFIKFVVPAAACQCKREIILIHVFRIFLSSECERIECQRLVPARMLVREVSSNE